MRFGGADWTPQSSSENMTGCIKFDPRKMGSFYHPKISGEKPALLSHLLDLLKMLGTKVINILPNGGMMVIYHMVKK